MMRTWRAAAIAAVAAAVMFLTACGAASGLFRQYEYEEEIYLSLDGTATVYVNSSIAALDALRGAPLDLSSESRVDRDAVRAFFSTPVTRVGRIAQSRRSGRRFVHVRVDVDDIQRLSEAGPFHWSSYSFRRESNLFVYRQSVGGAANKAVGNVGWNGRETVAFRMHLPSKITYHNAGADNLKRGNILVWEQSLADRLRGEPLVLDARMQTQSILYRTISLFGASVLAVAATFAFLILMVLFVGRKRAGGAGPAPRA